MVLSVCVAYSLGAAINTRKKRKMKNKNIYIPGDLVMYNGKVRIIKEPRDKKHFDLREPETNLRVCYIPIHEIAPVPLTPEILEKNRWKLRQHHLREGYYDIEWFKFNNPNLCIQLKYYCEDKCFLPFCCGNVISEKDIFYIHQLQHLLFGLGIDNEMII